MITLKNISKYYYSESSVELGLRKINLEFNKGEFVAITGESGSGKSTLLNVISGMDSYEDGEMYYNGQPTSYYSEEEWNIFKRDHIGFIYQGYNLIDSYTVLENIESILLLKEDHDETVTDKAMEYLEKVGLTEQANNRASQLSSGQKQRLSIARALAKETEIIVADEPTGNLDVENGKHIMELLYKLSADRLVIVVTHNYEQAEAYVTRKIRLFDGEIAEDTLVNPPIKPIDTSVGQKISKHIGKEKKEVKKDRLKVSWKFVKMNRKAQPLRNSLIFILLLAISFSYFVFFGEVCKNINDATSKYYNDAAFANGDTSRIVVRHEDGSAITADNLTEISNIKYVNEVEKYDGISDINFFYKEGEDYEWKHRMQENTHTDLPSSSWVEFTDFSKFMKSSSCITKDDLSEGELPSAYNEVVMYSSNDSVLGETITFYFCNKNMWSDLQYVEIDMKVVGILKENTEQVYFTEDLSKTIGINTKQYSNKYCYYQDGQSVGRGLSTKSLSKNENWKRSKVIENPILVMNSDLEEGQAIISATAFDNSFNMPSNSVVPLKIKKNVRIVYSNQNLDGKTEYADLELLSTESGHGTNVIEISKELFYKIFPLEEEYQTSIYIDDTAYTDDVLKSLEKLGYEAASVYRMGATSYNIEEVTTKMTTIVICAVAFVIIFFIGSIIVYSLIRLKKGDFIILKSLGMDTKMVNTINKLDTISSAIAAMVIVIIFAIVLNLSGVGFIKELIKFYRLFHYIVLFIISALMGMYITRMFNKYLEKKKKITDLKED